MDRVVRTVELRTGVTLPYVEQGDPSGTTLLLVHGLADSWRAFEPMLPHLPDSIHAVALTQRGHGDASRPTAGYGVADLAQDLVAFMEALRVEEAVVAGASSGGMVALRLALEVPERVRRLVLLGSPATLGDKALAQELWDSTISTLADPVDPEFLRRFQAGSVVQPVPPDFLETMVRESAKLPAFVWRAMTESFLREDPTAELGRIATPTLVVWGDQDPLTKEDQELFVAAIPDVGLVVYAGAGHAFYWEEPQRVAADLAAFVRAG